MNSPELDQLMKLLARLPGFGPRSARRAALHLIERKETLMVPLAQSLQQTAQKIRRCSVCGNLDTYEPCLICRDVTRDRGLICVIEQVAQLWALERAGVHRGCYHVLGGTLSALDGVGPDDLFIDGLVKRCEEEPPREIILGLNATVDGQTTAHYLAQRLAPLNLNITRLAHGVPVGGELDHLDEGTLSQALRARRPV